MSGGEAQGRRRVPLSTSHACAAAPTENAPPTNYTAELTAIAAQLVAYAAQSGGKTKLAFAHTTPYICTAQQDGCVQTLNHWADAIMASFGIPVLKTYEAVIAECGAAPQASCFGENGCV